MSINQPISSDAQPKQHCCQLEIHLVLARGEATAVFLLDQSANFETIDHRTIIACLSSWFNVGG